MNSDSCYQLPELNYREFFLQLCGLRQKLRITGISMQPTLNPGEEVLLNPHAYKRRSPQVNDIVVILHPQQPGLEIVKRVNRVIHSKQGDRYFLLGDNLNHSRDSRSFGSVSKEQILGKLTTSAKFAN